MQLSGRRIKSCRDTEAQQQKTFRSAWAGTGTHDADSCRRSGFEPFLPDGDPAHFTRSLRAGIQPLDGSIDRFEVMLRLPDEGFDL
jgi:hypothetical protein